MSVRNQRSKIDIHLTAESLSRLLQGQSVKIMMAAAPPIEVTLQEIDFEILAEMLRLAVHQKKSYGTVVPEVTKHGRRRNETGP